MRRAALIAALALSGCYAPAQQSVQSANGDVRSELLTTFEDCRVYRIFDAGRAVYIARCGADVRTEWSNNCGKNCTSYEQSVTVDPLAPKVSP